MHRMPQFDDETLLQLLIAMYHATRDNIRIRRNVKELTKDIPGFPTEYANHVGAQLAQRGLLDHQGIGQFVITEAGVMLAKANGA